MSDWVIFAGMLLGAFVFMFLVSTILDHRRKMAEIKHSPIQTVATSVWEPEAQASPDWTQELTHTVEISKKENHR